MELLLIRHAQPVLLVNHDGTAADPALSALGHRQAAAMAEWVAAEPVDAVYVSPMLRARETASPLLAALSLEGVIEDGVAEFDRDHHSYIPIEQMKADKAAWKKMMDRNGSESLQTFRSGVVATIDTIIDANPGRRVAVVCHGGVISSYMSHVMGIERPLFFEAQYASVNRLFASSKGHRTVGTLNEAHFLRLLPKP